MSQLKKDFVFKLFTNIIRIPVSFLLQSIYPRILGPIAYGNFDYLNDFANKIVGFLDSGVSVAFYTRLSQDKFNRKIVKFYSWLVLLIIIVYILLVITTYLNSFYIIIWPGQDFIIILLSTLLGVVTFCSNNIFRMIDACEQTIKGEWVKMGQLILTSLVVILFYFIFKKVTLEIFYIIQIILIIVLLFSLYFIFKKSGFLSLQSTSLSKNEKIYYSKYFWTYASPLLVTGVIALISGIGERWILQRYGGSVEQGYFALSSKIGALIFLFTSAMMPLLMRETSKLFGLNQIVLIKNLFLKNLKILYCLVTFMAVYVSINSHFIIKILAGNKFTQAGVVVALMAYYPIHQTVGQINSTLFMSTERTKEYRNISLFFIPFTVIFSYFFIAPKSQFGLGLGALGLGIEMIFIQIVVQNVLLFFNCKYLKISFIKIIFYQIWIILMLLLIGYIEYILICIMESNIYIIAISHFLIFTTSILMLVYIYPKIIGLANSQQILQIFIIKQTNN